MRLLYIDKDLQAARRLHGQLLEYRATNWNLTHCNDARRATELLSTADYEAILYRSSASIDLIERELRALLDDQLMPPVVSLIDELTHDLQLKLVQFGCEDTLDGSSVDGVSVMRSLRMAETRRNSISQRQEPDLDLMENRKVKLSSFLKRHSQPAAETTPLKIAVVADQTSVVAPCLESVACFSCEVYSAPRLMEAIQESQECSSIADLMIVESAVFETLADRDRNKLEQIVKSIPSIVVTVEKSDFAALTYLQRGYLDCLVAEQLDTERLTIAIEKLILRYLRHSSTRIDEHSSHGLVKDRRTRQRGGADRRRHARFYFEQSVVAIPILPNNAPDLSGRCQAMTIDLSISGIALRFPHRDQIPQRNWLLGLEQPNGKVGYVHAFLRRAQYVHDELHAGMVFQSDADDFLRPQSLTPCLQPDNMRFDTKVANESLEKWASIGVLSKRLVRRASVCPECRGTCTVAEGCEECGSFAIQFQELIHHFACAHVSFEHDFKTDDAVVCPKCRTKDLVVGADFELIRTQYRCEECCHQSDETAEVGCCLNCDLHFPISLAPEIEVYGYDVERLDVLALVDSAR